MKGMQLLVVKAVKCRCRIYCMERRGNTFVQVLPTVYGYVGRNGVTANKREGDGRTPAGAYAIGTAFGIRKVRTGLDFLHIDSKCRWCCDSGCRYYNSHTEKRWLKDCEDMWKYRREYKYGAVIEYNTNEDRVSGKGSAIFLHCKNSPTAGCVAAEEEPMKGILKWLDKNKHPCIFIEASKIVHSRKHYWEKYRK